MKFNEKKDLFILWIIRREYPLQTAYFGRKSGELRMKNTKRTDIRVKIMNEILLGIQVIKMYAWENSFAKLVDRIRK